MHVISMIPQLSRFIWGTFCKKYQPEELSPLVSPFIIIHMNDGIRLSMSCISSYDIAIACFRSIAITYCTPGPNRTLYIVSPIKASSSSRSRERCLISSSRLLESIFSTRPVQPPTENHTTTTLFGALTPPPHIHPHPASPQCASLSLV